MASIPQIIREEEGARLRAAYQRFKLRNRLTQTDIAAACGWKNASTFNRLMSGAIPLSLDSLTRISTLLDVSPSLISPRLSATSHEGVLDKALRFLPVSTVPDVNNSSWGDPFPANKRLPFFTADQSAFALVFDPAGCDAEYSRWVIVIEPGSQVVPGDTVIVKGGSGSTYGVLIGVDEKGSLAVTVQGKGDILTTRKKSMLVAGYARMADLVDIRACAGE